MVSSVGLSFSLPPPHTIPILDIPLPLSIFLSPLQGLFTSPKVYQQRPLLLQDQRKTRRQMYPQTLVRINFINKKHKSIQDFLGEPTCHVFERGKENLWYLKTGKKKSSDTFPRTRLQICPTVVCAGFLFSFLPFTTVFTSSLLALLPFLPSHFLSCTGNGRKALFPKRLDCRSGREGVFGCHE